MSVENLDVMTSEQLMLRDLLYEIPDLLEKANEKNRDFQHGVFTALRLLELKLQTFEIDQSRFARQMPDIEAWYR